MADSDGGRETVVGEVLRRAGGQLDPDLCRTFAAHTETILAALDTDDIFAVTLAREPAPRRAVSAEEIDRACLAFASFADLKGRLLFGHSLHVADSRSALHSC